jgi:anion-transporting  ArsA/GET3 family ATPase
VITDVLHDRRVVVCCGAGGVGKTTVSASVGLALARRGRRAAVVTIDPARRLASALGLEHLGDEPHRVTLPADVPGELWALQLDAKATFDRLVRRHAPDDEAAERILANRIYGHLSGAVAGSQEFMAVERLNELLDDGRFEVVVLDTPPAQNALDFLDAPERITRFIEGRALRLLMRGPSGGAGRIGWRVLHAGSSTVLSVLERLTGARLLRDITEFVREFDGMYQGFAERARAVREMLTSPDAAFVVIAAPREAAAREAVALWERLAEDGYPGVGVVLNRMHPGPGGEPPDPAALRDALAAAGAADPGDLADRVLAQHEDDAAAAARDRAVRGRLLEAIDAPLVSDVPEMPEDPVDVDGLDRVAEALLPA